MRPLDCPRHRFRSCTFAAGQRINVACHNAYCESIIIASYLTTLSAVWYVQSFPLCKASLPNTERLRERVEEESEVQGVVSHFSGNYCHHYSVFLFVHCHFHTTRVRRTSGQTLGTFKQSNERQRFALFFLFFYFQNSLHTAQ
jgi:hypothetical protein